MNAYYEIFKGTDKQMKEKAAVAWSQWEAATSSILINEARIEGFSNIDFAIAFATIENHYFINGGFFENEDQLIENIDSVRSIPSVIVQGRYDVVCPMGQTTSYLPCTITDGIDLTESIFSIS